MRNSILEILVYNMKELGKYLTLMTAFLLMMFGLVFGQAPPVEVESIRQNFTGDKMRVTVDLSGDAKYAVHQDWEANLIRLDINGVEYRGNANTGKWKNYIVGNVEVVNTASKLTLQLSTKGESLVTYGYLKNGNRIYLDVRRNFRPIGVSTLLKRGAAYEKRREYTKASLQYKKALDKKPQDNAIKFFYARSLSREGAIEEAIQAFENIDPESKYYEKSVEHLSFLLLEGDKNENQNRQAQDKVESEAPKKIEKNANRAALKVTGIDVSTISNEEKPKKASEREPKTATEIPGAESAQVPGQNIPEQPKNTDNKNNQTPESLSMSGILKKSGADNYLLYALYGVAGVMLLVVMFLVRKVFKLYMRPKKKRKTKRKPQKQSLIAVPLKQAKSKTVSKKGDFVKKEQIEEVQLFANKLANLYKRTDSASAINKPVKKATVIKKQADRAPVSAFDNKVRSSKGFSEALQDHTQKIENIFQASDNAAFNTESVNLVKKFKGATSNSSNSGDKHTAVLTLHKQGWEEWEIARELGMGFEEVKIALEMGGKQNKLEREPELYSQIYNLYDLKLTETAIAERLNLGEEEVKLALKMRNTQESFA